MFVVGVGSKDGCRVATRRETGSTALQADQATWWTCDERKLRSGWVGGVEHHVIEGSISERGVEIGNLRAACLIETQDTLRQ